MSVSSTETRVCPVSVAGLPCIEHTNPRYAGHCFRCSQTMPAKPTPRQRNLNFEREFTRSATRHSVDCEALIDHSEARASSLSSEYVSDPMLIAPGRDRYRDGLEELADCRNHLNWGVEEDIEIEEIGPLAEEAMDCIARAYDRIRQIRELKAEIYPEAARA